MQRGGELWESGSNYFFILSTVITFVIPVILLVLPWFALLVQVLSLKDLDEAGGVELSEGEELGEVEAERFTYRFQIYRHCTTAVSIKQIRLHPEQT